jgi:glyoxylase-like metal-dependent hydrolase (beta-lactamase superfamily II)
VLRSGYPAELYTERFAGKAVDQLRLPAGFTTERGLPGCEPTGFLAHGDHVDLGDRVLEVLHTPGHSPGGLSFLDRQARVLFVADLLYLGRMFLFFPTSDTAQFRESLHLMTEQLDDVDTIYPAHGKLPVTPADVRAIRDAFELVWQGRKSDAFGSTYGYDVAIHDFGRFSFLLKRS